jgi:hypothetical protein
VIRKTGAWVSAAVVPQPLLLLKARGKSKLRIHQRVG